MKKILFGLALLLAGTSATMAQSNSNAAKSDNACPRTECAKAAVCSSTDSCNQCGVCQNCPGPGKCVNQDCPYNKANCKAKGECPVLKGFEGINLTDSQKSRIKEICETNRKSGKQDKQAIRANKIERKKNFLENVKTVLTPEQYVAFLENNYINGGKVKAGKDMSFHKGDKKKDRKGDRKGRGHGNHACLSNR